MTERTKLLLERITIALIFAGIIMLCQPFTMALYSHGFPILLGGTVAFIVVSRLKTRPEETGLTNQGG